MVDLESAKVLQRHLQIGLCKFAQAGMRDCHNLKNKKRAVLLFVIGLSFRALAKSDLAGIADQHAAILLLL